VDSESVAPSKRDCLVSLRYIRQPSRFSLLAWVFMLGTDSIDIASQNTPISPMRSASKNLTAFSPQPLAKQVIEITDLLNGWPANLALRS
jgi:hypothetical protein